MRRFSFAPASPSISRDWIFPLFIIETNAGVVNPDISATGQILGNSTKDNLLKGEKDFFLGKAEVVLDAPLNPYISGMFVLQSIRNQELILKNTSLIRGLPLKILF